MKRILPFLGIIYSIFLCSFSAVASGYANEPSYSIFSENNGFTYTAVGTHPFYGIVEMAFGFASPVSQSVFPEECSVFYGFSATGYKKSLKEAAFQGYSKRIKNFPIAFGKAKIIFPFHYFW
ncbi:hypothetical protein U1E44_03655 [Arenibacter sp. GZD96]|uniref:hypothetical protein n=1 Tax=Aurantibrevibacter litoralis TaxID=3106030 RepID=UPI002AFEAD48|nr:hypothetical protein [Arenibacter sp. GZD-96]MEA1785174.1 hypothetical protein [Arenibacter sp. GZD-96]